MIDLAIRLLQGFGAAFIVVPAILGPVLLLILTPVWILERH